MAWTTPRTWVAGEVVTAALLNVHVRDNLSAIGSPTWATYTPTLTGFTGSVSHARWTQIGKTVHVDVRIGWSTTTAGTLYVSLPTAQSAAAALSNMIGSSGAYDASATTYYTGGCFYETGNQRAYFVVSGATAPFSGTAPMTWATSDVLWLTATYEAA